MPRWIDRCAELHDLQWLVSAGLDIQGAGGLSCSVVRILIEDCCKSTSLSGIELGGWRLGSGDGAANQPVCLWQLPEAAKERDLFVHDTITFLEPVPTRTLQARQLIDTHIIVSLII